MRRILAVAALALTFTVLGGAQPVPTLDYPPCPQEDSPGPCRWDALHRGNGRGQSFIVTADQRVIYLAPLNVSDDQKGTR